MDSLLKFSEKIDKFLNFIALIGGWMGVALIIVVCYDVATRYFGVPKFFGMNSTMVQESEYWFHTFLFALVIGFAYTKQSHVRIDLVRDRLPIRTKYLIECVGIAFFLMTYVAIGAYFTAAYTLQSFLEHEVSKSTIGLSNIWIVKSMMPIMFVLLGLAGVSQFIKAYAGFTGRLPDEKIAETLGGDL